ncbi:MAG: glycoside hydrolase family 3 C-terminal domain-containing protein [Cyanosarcina radialis HA8281-LM2]|jgi:beta-glucosidase|nr:glycoside hydrolase family 3 C-terminal domain-containing protein [Cyanosarcina radialis HA8281-LM2]
MQIQDRISSSNVNQAEAERRAAEIEAQMTDDERFGLIYNLMVYVYTGVGRGERDPRVPEHIPQIAGWTKGIPRLGIPDLLHADGPLGITNPASGREGDTATALPSGQMLGSTFNPHLACEMGAILGREAKARGFNVALGGGINLSRDPRNGRNFEYLSEDPWLSAVLAAETVKGVQEQKVIGMVKHLSLNSQETNKWNLDAQIDPAAHRESELLAFQIAIERGHPGSIMGAYNKVNGEYCCGNSAILNDAIKEAIGFRGFIMSDWKAVWHWDYALKGLDMHSGAQVDQQEWFVGPLREAYDRGEFPKERLADMVRRILTAIYQVGVDKWSGPQEQPDLEAHLQTAIDIARQGTVLLKNDGILPIAPDVKTIAVIGGFATKGMLTGGGGSSLTDPIGGFSLDIPLGGTGFFAGLRRLTMAGPSVVAELQKQFPNAQILFSPGEIPKDAAAIAKRADVVVVMALRTESENNDYGDLSLPWGQGEVIEAAISANPNTIVVFQTGNPIDMPWRDRARAIVASWFSGNVGGRVLPEILSGAVNPSGRLPVTFYANVEQTPHPVMPGFGTPNNTPTVIHYHEGAEVGYRWLAKTGEKPNYAFGHGLSYTTFGYSDFQVSGGETVTASFTVANTGTRAGADVPQVYLVDAPGEKRMRLLGFDRVELKPGESRRVELTADPRLLARFDGAKGQWRIDEGTYRVSLSRAADDPVETVETQLAGRYFGR